MCIIFILNIDLYICVRIIKSTVKYQLKIRDSETVKSPWKIVPVSQFAFSKAR